MIAPPESAIAPGTGSVLEQPRVNGQVVSLELTAPLPPFTPLDIEQNLEERNRRASELLKLALANAMDAGDWELAATVEGLMECTGGLEDFWSNWNEPQGTRAPSTGAASTALTSAIATEAGAAVGAKPWMPDHSKPGKGWYNRMLSAINRRKRAKIAPGLGAIILFGPPGGGKGTIAEMIEEEFGAILFSSGAAFREHATDEQRARMKQGKLLEDHEVDTITDLELIGVDRDVLLVDGTPRKKSQIKGLKKILGKAAANALVLVLEAKDEQLLVDRIVKRGKEEGRADDQDEKVVWGRQRTYQEDTIPVRRRLKRQYTTATVDATQDKDAVYADVRAVLLAHAKGELPGPGILPVRAAKAILAKTGLRALFRKAIDVAPNSQWHYFGTSQAVGL